MLNSNEEDVEILEEESKNSQEDEYKGILEGVRINNYGGNLGSDYDSS